MDRPEQACPLPLGGDDDRIRAILEKPRTVAVVGMSPKPERPSNEVGMYLHRAGFTVIPVHPAGGEISGLRVFPSLEEIPKETAVEIVDLFVAGPRTMELVEEAARIKAKYIWFQPGAENPKSEARAKALGLEVVSGICTKAEHQRLIG
ncbi:MAG: CoA-binding protein [Planctomycetes bacterium]|nr:CoA-binding protein [Planctomycetota bacterium]